MSPFGAATLEADKTRVRRADEASEGGRRARHTVLMVQVENEINAYGSAARLFAGGDEGCLKGRCRRILLQRCM